MREIKHIDFNDAVDEMNNDPKWVRASVSALRIARGQSESLILILSNGATPHHIDIERRICADSDE